MRNQYFNLALLSGILLALSWPARGFPFLIFFAFVPLFWMEDRALSRRYQVRTAGVFLYFWLAFGVFNLLTTWWILHATLPGMIAAVLLNSLFMAIPWTLMHWSRRILPASQGPLPVIVFWLAFEYLHTHWELSWNWLDLGNAFASYPAWVQWYEISGTAGGSLWILSINIFLFYALKFLLGGYANRRKARWNGVLALCLFVIPSLFSFYLWITYVEEPSPVSVVVVQPSEDPYGQVRSTAESRQRIDDMIALADERITPATRFVLAPEGANPMGIWMDDAEGHHAVQRLREHIRENPGLVWIMGSFTYRMLEEGEEAGPTARPYGRTGNHYEAFNSAFLVEAGQEVQFHHKSMLVPGIERMPYARILQPLGRLVDRFGGISGSLGTQSHRNAFVTADQERIAPAVCYESIYGDFMTGYLRDGASLLFILTNDGWWRETPGHRQHLQYARLRAIETRRSVARSASTGISAFINQRGEILDQAGWWEATSLSATLNKNHSLTFFARTGNYLGKMAVFLSGLFFLFVATQYLIRRRP